MDEDGIDEVKLRSEVVLRKKGEDRENANELVEGVLWAESAWPESRGFRVGNKVRSGDRDRWRRCPREFDEGVRSESSSGSGMPRPRCDGGGDRPEERGGFRVSMISMEMSSDSESESELWRDAWGVVKRPSVVVLGHTETGGDDMASRNEGGG